MAKPILEKIADEVLARLQSITIANGYEFDASAVVMVNRDTNAWDAKPRRIIINQTTETENPDHNYPGNPPAVAYDVQFEITGYASQLDVKGEVGVLNTNVTDTQMIAAIRKALANNDASGWHTFDGNAFNASFGTSTTVDAPGHDGAQVVLTVQYRTSEIDPFVRR
jgi:hypothetical protein